MARPRKSSSSSELAASPQLLSWAETFGEALGRGVARGINTGLANLQQMGMSLGNGRAPQMVARRGRPPKVQSAGPVPADRLCKVEGCNREARSKGLCSAHYQAERRRAMAQA